MKRGETRTTERATGFQSSYCASTPSWIGVAPHRYRHAH